MILKADDARARHVLHGLVELVRGAVRVLARRGPLVEVHVDDLDAVEDHIDSVRLAGDGVTVPFTGGLRRGDAR